MLNQPEKFLTWGLILLLVVLVISTILLGSVPPVDRDALTHHLFVPKLWLQHGGIYEIPEIPFSYYPMNLDLLYTIPLYFGNDIIPKYIHYLFALLTAWLLFAYLKKRLGTVYGCLGALFFLSTPIIIKLSVTVYVDLGLMFFSTASLLLLLHWAESSFQPRFLILAGICCGLAAGVKYNGLLSLFLLTLCTPVVFQQFSPQRQQNNGKSILFGIVFVAVSFSVFSPWLIKNYLQTGNPLYPLHSPLIGRSNLQPAVGQPGSDPLVEEAARANTPINNNDFITRKILYQETWWQTLLLPVRYFFEGRDDDPRYFDGKLNPFLLLLPLFAFLWPPNSPRHHLQREKRVLLAFTLVFYFLTLFLQPLRIRYIVSIVPMLVLLSVFGVHALVARSALMRHNAKTLGIRLLVVSLTIFFLGYNGFYIHHLYQQTEPLGFLSGSISRDQYISKFRPEYPAIQFINNAPQVTKVLALYVGNRGYYFDKPVQFDWNKGQSFLYETARFAQDERQLNTILLEDGISHILVRYDLFEQWIGKQQDHVATNRLFKFFQTHAVLVIEANGHGVFRLHTQTTQ